LPNPAQPYGFVTRVAGMVGIAVILALLYFGRGILVPITLAIILSLLITPFIRKLRRLGLGHTVSVAVAVVLTALVVGAIGIVLGSQVLRIGESLPQYAGTIRNKLDVLNHLTLGRLDSLNGQAGQFLSEFERGQAVFGGDGADALNPAHSPLLVQIQTPPVQPARLLVEILSLVWQPVATSGVVLVVLIFVLFEHEALRDRFIRLAGSEDLRGTTIAVNDAGERLSRFFISQFAVNICVGLTIGIVLALIGVSEAILWGAMAAILRFVPYIGVWIAAFCATILAAAMSPAWDMAVGTLVSFFVIEMVYAQLVEPRLYGHTTGLSPLSIVVAAIFWSSLWGPVGLVLSTPLTLCLVVSGRYFRALNMFEILLGEIPALTKPQNFYQRALSGDVQEIISSARSWLRKKSFAGYCDSVLIPALHLARADMDANTISQREQAKVSSSIVSVIATLERNPKWWTLYPRVSVLQGISAGQHLRQQRERASVEAKIEFNAGHIVCTGAGGMGDELATEILVRILQKQGLDGQHVLSDSPDKLRSLATDQQGVSVCCVVSITPVKEHEEIITILRSVESLVPSAKRIGLLIPSPFEEMAVTEYAFGKYCEVVTSIEETVQVCLKLQHAYDN